MWRIGPERQGRGFFSRRRGFGTLLRIVFNLTRGRPVSSKHPPTGDAIPQDLRLRDIGIDEEVELVRFDLPIHQAEALMERGLPPGCRVCPVRKSPSGDPIVMVDGVMLALRDEVAGCVCVKPASRDD